VPSTPGELGGSNPGLRSDEELQEVLIGDLQPHDAPVTLAEYSADWPRLFDREARRIRAVLGAKALRVEHAGSTSVPGLPAKPIIDILLAVADSADEPSYLPALESARVVRAPAVQRPGHRYQPACVQRRRIRDRPDAAFP
jgi:GrpB-like predicted nucleotidyltransferase (UPF0157 family)